MKKTKKIISLVLICCIILSSGITVSAKEIKKDKKKETNIYEQIVEEYNSIYDVSLQYIDVSPETNVDEYRKFIEETAKGERDTLDYIESRDKDVSVLSDTNMISPDFAVSATAYDITKTQPAISASFLASSSYKVKCTYTNYGTYLGNPRNVGVSVKSSVLIGRYFTVSTWSSRSLDLGITLGVTTKGTLTEYSVSNGTSWTVSGVTVYAEFYK